MIRRISIRSTNFEPRLTCSNWKETKMRSWSRTSTVIKKMIYTYVVSNSFESAPTIFVVFLSVQLNAHRKDYVLCHEWTQKNKNNEDSNRQTFGMIFIKIKKNILNLIENMDTKTLGSLKFVCLSSYSKLYRNINMKNICYESLTG